MTDKPRLCYAEVAERTKAPVLRTGGAEVPQGFKSLPRRLIFGVN